jgi:hypothetical protein
VIPRRDVFVLTLAGGADDELTGNPPPVAFLKYTLRKTSRRDFAG